jgi:hypothetical protein
MAVSQHARKTQAPGVAQFDSFSLSQGPSSRRVLHEVGPNFSPKDIAQCYWWRVPSPGKMAHYVAGEYGGAALRLGTHGATVGQRDRTKRVLGPTLYTPPARGWSCKTSFERMWPRAAALSSWMLILGCRELLWNLSLLSGNLHKFRLI